MNEISNETRKAVRVDILKKLRENWFRLFCLSVIATIGVVFQEYKISFWCLFAASVVNEILFAVNGALMDSQAFYIDQVTQVIVHQDEQIKRLKRDI
jgi:hypothetical protein